MVALRSAEFPAFCLQKGTTSRESFAATKYSNFFKRGTTLCFGCSLFMFDPQSLGQRSRFSSVFNGGRDINSETQHNIFVVLGRIKSGAGDWYKNYHLYWLVVIGGTLNIFINRPEGNRNIYRVLLPDIFWFMPMNQVDISNIHSTVIGVV
jgi:hypothetical protein